MEVTACSHVQLIVMILGVIEQLGSVKAVQAENMVINVTALENVIREVATSMELVMLVMLAILVQNAWKNVLMNVKKAFVLETNPASLA